MNVFALIEAIFKLIGLWEGLKTYVNQQEISKMRTDILKIHEQEEIIKNAKDENTIYSAQSNVTKHS